MGQARIFGQTAIVSGQKEAVLVNIGPATFLPDIVVDGQIVVITTTPFPMTYFSYDTPEAPAEGDLWVHTVDSGGYEVVVQNSIATIVLTPSFVRQYVGGSWWVRDAYLGVNGTWQMFSATSAFSELSWAQIGSLTASGDNLSVLWNVGDTHSLSVNGVDYTVEILGFMHDNLADGSGKAGLTLGLVNCLNTAYKMNGSNTNSGGWGSCALRSTLQGTILKQLPAELQTIIRPVTKLASAGNTSTAINSYTDTLFLFSEQEVFGARTYSTGGEGTQYARFAAAASRKKTVNGSVHAWWLRSPYVGNSLSFCAVDYSGTANHSVTSGSQCVAFGFCV